VDLTRMGTTGQIWKGNDVVVGEILTTDSTGFTDDAILTKDFSGFRG
jgi:hypothetical protein